MSERPRETHSRTLVRFAGISVAFALTIVAAWLIALGNSKQQSSLGVIIGLWAALIGAMTFFGGRGVGTMSSASSSGTGADVELRQDFALELQREVSARRAYEQQLHEMVRREIETIQRVVGDQLGKLRDDVATLRGDLVDQVGGKIRLERIETTRVIGSDIEALQNEVRQLAGGRITDQVNRPAEPSARIVEQRPIEQPVAQPVARVVDDRRIDRRADDRRSGQRPGDRSSLLPGLPGSNEPAGPSPVNAPSAPAPIVAAPAPPPRPDPVPAYTPYVAPTYAPAVTYAAGSLEPQYSGPAPAAPSPTPLTAAPAPAPAAAAAAPAVAPPVPLAVPPASVPSQPTSYPSFSQPAASLPDSSLPRLSLPPSFELPAASVPAAPVQPLPRVTPLPTLSTAPAATNGSNGYGGSNGAAPDAASDPFAGLPRLSRFEDDDPLPPLPQPQSWQPPALATQPTPAVPAAPEWQAPVEQWTPPAMESGNGRRHGAPEEEPASAPPVGRRRRTEGDTDDVLARLLGRPS